MINILSANQKGTCKIIKTTKKLFETIKKKSKYNYYNTVLTKYKNDIKKNLESNERNNREI